MEIENALKEIVEFIKTELPNAGFDAKMSYEYDSNKGYHWVATGRFDIREGWNDFVAYGDSIEELVQNTINGIEGSISELLTEM